MKFIQLNSWTRRLIPVFLVFPNAKNNTIQNKIPKSQRYKHIQDVGYFVTFCSNLLHKLSMLSRYEMYFELFRKCLLCTMFITTNYYCAIKNKCLAQTRFPNIGLRFYLVDKKMDFCNDVSLRNEKHYIRHYSHLNVTKNTSIIESAFSNAYIQHDHLLCFPVRNIKPQRPAI